MYLKYLNNYSYWYFVFFYFDYLKEKLDFNYSNKYL